MKQVCDGTSCAYEDEHWRVDIPLDTYFPEEAANLLAELEAYNKHRYRPNTYLHKWWARRAGTTFRYILKQLVEDPEKRDYYCGGGLEGKVILDPMMGGGTTLHEALRLGANVIGIDIDPIPYLQAKVTLSESYLPHRRQVFEKFYSQLRRKVGKYFVTTCPACGGEAEVQYVLYGIRKECSCREVVVIDDFVLRRELNEEQNICICPACQAVYSGNGHTCQSKSELSLIGKVTERCGACGERFQLLNKIPLHERYVPLVVFGHCSEHNWFFKKVEKHDLDLIEMARTSISAVDFCDVKRFEIPQGPKSTPYLLDRGVKSYLDLFTPRQLVFVKSCVEEITRFEETDRLWLALLVSTALEFNSILCGYKGDRVYKGNRRSGAVRHVFSHHVFVAPCTALENNPTFSSATSGSLKRIFKDRIVRAMEWSMSPTEVVVDPSGKRKKILIEGEIDGGIEVDTWADLSEGSRRFLILQGDSSSFDIPEGRVDFVVTDPPYYDSVQYSDLSNFFRVWLGVLLPHKAKWAYDPDSSVVAGGGSGMEDRYGEALTAIWRMCAHSLKQHGRLIFSFHHWSPDAWANLTLSLRRTGFRLINRYVVVSENPVSVHIRDLRALKHDTILVLGRGAEHSGPQVWPRLSNIDTSDSEAFCRDCGEAIGWLLNQEWGDDEIRREWKRLFEIPRGGDS